MGFKLDKKKSHISDINVTPLVDVMLVLLVIFMITAPLMLNGIKLDLPKTKEVNRVNLTTSQVILSVTRSGNYFIGKKRHLQDELVAVIQEDLKKSGTNVLYLRADYSLKYGLVAKIMSFLKRGGVTKIALVTETEE